jgi:hypothetical protein
LKDKKISIVFRHWIPFSLTDSGKTHPLGCNQFRRRFRLALLADRYPQSNEDSPLGLAPFGQEYQKRIFYDRLRRLITADYQLDVGVFSGTNLQTGLKLALVGFEFSMGYANGAQSQ